MLKWIVVLIYIPGILLGKAGIGFSPGEIAYNNLQIGQIYDFRELSNTQHVVVNKSDSPVSVAIVKFKPSKSSVKKGYEPILDLNWVRVVPDIIKNIKPKKRKKVGIIVSIPDEEKYLGKKYQIMLQARTIGKSFIGVAMNNRILITISKEKAKAKKELKKPAKFSVMPLEIRIEDLILDQKEVYRKIKVKNLSDRKVTYEIVILSVEQAERKLIPGYDEFPKINLVKPVDNYFILKPGEKTEASIKIKIRKKWLKKGKKYQFYINIRTFNEDIIEEFYVPVYINIKE